MSLVDRFRRAPRFTDEHRERLLDLGRRSQQVLGVAALLGVVTGLGVAAFDRLTAGALLAAVRDAPLAVQVAAPLAGLVLASVLLWAGGRRVSPSTADEYIRAFHERSPSLPMRPVPFRMAAAIATLGGGAPLGYEGPAMYLGASIGSALQRGLRRFSMSGREARVLLVAGAAAGVSAVFKAPLTGLVFALEVPYQEDLARRMLLPAAISSAASYLTFAAIVGTEPILPISGQPPFDLVDLGGAVLLGLAAGLLARGFLRVIGAAKSAATKGHPMLRAVGGGLVIGATVLLAAGLGDSSLSLGPGYHALEWAMDPRQSLVAIAALGLLRVAGTAAAVGGGGTGGLFIPLVIQGALLGRVVGGLVEADTTTLFPLVGMAAFLGAGYRVPLAAVVFVAEFTGRPGFVVPGLIAAVVAQLVMGRRSISPYQVAGRVGHLEGRLQLPLASVVDAEVRTAPPDATVEELFWQHLVGTRQPAVPVVDGDRYLGLVTAELVGEVAKDAWATTTAAEVMRTDVPVASVDWVLGDAIRAIEGSGSDRVAVVSDDGAFVGVIRSSDLVQLDEVLDRTSGGS